jgi:Tol biopolymer transport system component
MTVRRLPLLCVLAATALYAPIADAKRIATRTIRISEGGDAGTSLRPVISDDGNFVAFDSNVPLLTGRADTDRDVFIRQIGGGTRLVSHTLDGGPPDGSATNAAVSADGKVVAFQSDATNMVPGDTNLATDVFIEVGGRVYPVSTTPDNQPANGDSTAPDISANGQVITFVSTASNLVPRDENGTADVFVRNLITGAIKRVSQSQVGFGGNGPSRAPAISPDGKFVSFASRADNLVPGDNEGLPDVFWSNLQSGTVKLVSVNNKRQEQDRAVRSPFVQISDISREGKVVVFDSDATNLDPDDRRLHTDVFVRDLSNGKTTRVSTSKRGESNSDSVYPRVTPDGRFVTFESFASNLFPFDAAGPDSYLYDRKTGLAVLVDVTNKGRLGDSHPRQLLQRPGVSADGNVTAFTARQGLVGADLNGAPDVYVRRVNPARARIRVSGNRYRIRADDPHADLFLCRFKTLVGVCPKKGKLGPLPHGRYKIFVRPFGLGIRPGPRAVARFRR